MDVDRYLQGMLERLPDEIGLSLRQLEDRGDPGVAMTSLEVTHSGIEPAATVTVPLPADR